MARWMRWWLVVCMAVGAWSGAWAQTTMELALSASGGTWDNASRTLTAQPAAAVTYIVNYSCKGTSGTCNNMKVTVPLGAMVNLMTGAVPVKNLVSAPQPSTFTWVGNDLVFSLGNVNNGVSATAQFVVTLPYRTTPVDASWVLSATATADGLSAVSTSAQNITTKVLVDARSYLEKTTDAPGSQVLIPPTGTTDFTPYHFTYTVTAQCQGNVYAQSFSVVDTLPADVVYVPGSASSYGQYDPATHTLTWANALPINPAASEFPSSCQASGTVNTYTFKAYVKPGVANNKVINNTVDSTWTPHGNGQPVVLTRTRPVTAVVTRTLGNSWLVKSAYGHASGASFPGDWLPEVSPMLNSNAAAVTYYLNLATGTAALWDNHTYELFDPVPCLAPAPTGTSLLANSRTVSTTGAWPVTTPAALCQKPGFHLQALQLVHLNTQATPFAALWATGWRPQVVLTDGSLVALDQLTLQTSGTTHYETLSVPAAARTRVAAIYLPPHALLDKALLSSILLRGYADQDADPRVWNQTSATLSLSNTAQTRVYSVNDLSTPVTTGSHTGSRPVRPHEVAVQAGKSMFASGTTVNGGQDKLVYLSLQAAAEVSTASPSPLVMADLLPAGLQLVNYPASQTIALNRAASMNSADITRLEGTMEVLRNYLGSGRDLLRITLPELQANGQPSLPVGSWVVRVAPGLAVPTTYGNGQPTNNPVAGSSLESYLYAWTWNEAKTLFNTLQVHHAALATYHACTQVLGGRVNELRADDPLGLSGRGLPDNCAYTTSVTLAGAGAVASSVSKLVKGNVDQFAGAQGHATPDGQGSAVYEVTWRNSGGPSTLTNPVVYDMLPALGDRRIDDATQARNSAFDVVFDGLVGALPTGVSVQYSKSLNPCRGEALSNAVPTPVLPTGCTNDWVADPTTAAFGGIDQVKALKLVSTGSYNSGQQFSVSYRVKVPAGTTGQLAYNAIAQRSNITTGPLLPATGVPAVLRLTDDGQVTLSKRLATGQAVTAHPGDSRVFDIVVANTGPVPAYQVVVADVLPAGLDFVSMSNATPTQNGQSISWTIAQLPAGGSMTFPVTVRVSAPAGQTLENLAATPHAAPGFKPVTASPACASDPQASCASVNVVSAPGTVQVFKAVADVSGNGQAEAGEQLSYGITVRNPTASALYGIEVSDVLDPNTSYISSDNGGQHASGVVRWTNLTVPANSSITLLVRARVATGLAAGTAIVNRVHETAQPVPDCAVQPDACASISTSGTPDLVVSKRVDASTAIGGQTLTYTIEVRNAGARVGAQVLVHDTLPAGLTQATWQCVGQGVSCPSASGAGNLAETVPSLPVGTGLTYTVSARVDPAFNGLVRNTVQVSTPDPDMCPASSPCTQSADTTVTAQSAQLGLVQTVDQANAKPGDTLTYTVTVTNTGNVDAHNLSISDLLPAGVTVVSVSHGGSASGQLLSWALPSLPVGQSLNLTITVTVDANAGSTLEARAALTPPAGFAQSVQSPCSDDTTRSCAVTSLAANAPKPVPTLSQAAWLLLSLMMLGLASRRRWH